MEMNRQYPRLVLRDSSFRSNARETISRCAACGIQVCGVIKGVNGLPEVARRFRECGVTQLGTSRLEQVALPPGGHPRPLSADPHPRPYGAAGAGTAV